MYKIPIKGLTENISLATLSHADGPISEYKEEKASIGVDITLYTDEQFSFKCSLSTKKVDDGKTLFYGYLVNNWVNHGELAISYQSIIVRYRNVKYTYIVESVNESA